MKKLLLFFCLLLLNFLAFSQNVTQYLGAPTTAVKTRGVHIIDSILSIPKRLSLLNKDTGSVYYKIADSAIMVWTGSQWIPIGGNTTASNGASKTGNDIRLGRQLGSGTPGSELLYDTEIPLNGNSLIFSSPETVSTQPYTQISKNGIEIWGDSAASAPARIRFKNISGSYLEIQRGATGSTFGFGPSQIFVPSSNGNFIFTKTPGTLPTAFHDVDGTGRYREMLTVGSESTGALASHARNVGRVDINDTTTRNTLLSVGIDPFTAGSTHRDRRATAFISGIDTIKTHADFVDGMSRTFDVQRKHYINAARINYNLTPGVSSNAAARSLMYFHSKDSLFVSEPVSLTSAHRNDLGFLQYPGYTGKSHVWARGVVGALSNINDPLTATGSTFRTANNGGTSAVSVHGYAAGFVPYFQLAARDTVQGIIGYHSGYLSNDPASRVHFYADFAALGTIANVSAVNQDSLYGFFQRPSTNFKNYFGNKVGIGKHNPAGLFDVAGNGNFDDTATAKVVRTPMLSGANVADPDFEFVVIPDPQNATENNPTILASMFNWVVANKTTANIKGVFCVGDNTDNANSTEFNRISTEFAKLDAENIPILTVMGNHDYDGKNPTARGATDFNTYFGPSRFSGKSYYGGNYSGSNENYFIRIPVGSVTYLVMGLEFYPRNAVITWAQGILNTYPADKVIVITHAYLDAQYRRSTDSSHGGPNTYSLGADNSGQELWDKLLKRNKNIFMVVGGHFLPNPYYGWPAVHYHFDDVGMHGNVVHNVVYNAQHLWPGGSGYFMRLKFKPAANKIDVELYSHDLAQQDPANPPYTISLNGVGVNGSLGVVGDVGVSGVVHAGEIHSDTIRTKNILGNRLRIGDFTPSFPIPQADATLQINGSIALQKDSLQALTNLGPVQLTGLDTTSGATVKVGRVPASSFVQTVGNQSVTGIKSFTDRMVITKGAGITPDVNNLLYIGRNEPGNFYPLFIIEDKTDDGYAQFGYWGKNRKWNVGVGNGPSSFFGVQDKYYILDATSNNVRFSIDTDGTVDIPELLRAKGGVATRARTVLANTTVDKYDHTLFIDASSGPITITLPSSSSSYYSGYGITYVFKRIDGSGNTITIQAAGSDNIDGNPTAGLNISAKQTITIQAAGGSAWYIIKN